MALFDHFALYDPYKEIHEYPKAETLALSSSLTYRSTPKKSATSKLQFRSSRCEKLASKNVNVPSLQSCVQEVNL